MHLIASMEHYTIAISDQILANNYVLNYRQLQTLIYTSYAPKIMFLTLVNSVTEKIRVPYDINKSRDDSVP